MDQHIEIEFKNLLNEEEFHRLMEHFQLDTSHFRTQQNHYFDTADFRLKTQQSALRIREKEGRFELTLKQPAAEGLLETNQSITQETAEALMNGKDFPEGMVYDLVKSAGLPPEDFRCFGTLKTDRIEFPYKNGLLVLDRSSYLGVEDFELEYEVTDSASGQKIFLSLLKTLQIPVRKTENKVKRFYRAKFNR